MSLLLLLLSTAYCSDISERLSSSIYKLKSDTDPGDKFGNCRYCIFSEFCKVCKSVSPFYGTSMSICSKKSADNPNCVENDQNTCTKFESKLEDNLICPSTCNYKKFNIKANQKVPFEYSGVGPQDLCYYKIKADADIDFFKVKVGDDSSKVLYTLFSEDKNKKLQKVSSTHKGTISVYAKYNKDFILLTLPKEDNNKIKFSLENKDKTKHPEESSNTLLILSLVLLTVLLAAIGGSLAYFFLFRKKDKYVPQVDTDDTFEGNTTTNRSRAVSEQFFTHRDDFKSNELKTKYIFSTTQYRQLREKIYRSLIIQREKSKTKTIQQEDKEFEADVIANNSARALFNFLRTNEANRNKVGRTYIPCLFIPDESTFFNHKKTRFSKILKNKIYKDHGIHRAKSYVNMIFRDRDVAEKMDECVSNFKKGEETDIIALEMLQVPEFHYILSMAMIFDVISTFGYKLDLIFTREFEKVAAGTYTFVLDQCGCYLNLLVNAINKHSEFHTGKIKDHITKTDVKQIKNFSMHDTLFSCTFFNTFKGDSWDEDKGEIKISFGDNLKQYVKFEKVSRKITTNHDDETLVNTYQTFQVCEDIHQSLFLKAM
ncbi:unnamed protein product [Moneuplotes crassus]|uniref:Uncharacterized protein n=1 Tax=Euplotes crassus TaxID=5936 RepID=A0AAD1U932_EUPCR|nr:unnamed protein product [Moneuplotes crassus]